MASRVRTFPHFPAARVAAGAFSRSSMSSATSSRAPIHVTARWFWPLLAAVLIVGGAAAYLWQQRAEEAANRKRAAVPPALRDRVRAYFGSGSGSSAPQPSAPQPSDAEQGGHNHDGHEHANILELSEQARKN